MPPKNNILGIQTGDLSALFTSHRDEIAMSDSEKSREDLLAELQDLRAKVANFENAQEDTRLREQQLRDKEAFNFALFQYSPYLTVIVDREGRVVRSNRAKLRSGDRLPNIGDRMYKDYASSHQMDMHRELLDAIESGQCRSYPELRYGNKYLAVTIAPFPHGAIIVSEDITDKKKAESDRVKLIDELKRALDEVETLRGLLPICAHCKRIRDVEGLWHGIESYISRHSLADFSHTMCPQCAEVFYPELVSRQRAREMLKNETKSS